MAPKSVTFRRHDHLVSVLFGDLLSHSYNITFSMFLDLVHTESTRNSYYRVSEVGWTLPVQSLLLLIEYCFMGSARSHSVGETQDSPNLESVTILLVEKDKWLTVDGL